MEIKKVEISMKNPETYQIMRFSSIKSSGMWGRGPALYKQNYLNPKITIFSKKSSILVILCHAEHLFLHSGQYRDKKKSWSPWKIPWSILYLNLGSLYRSLRKMRPKLLKKIPQNLNVRVFTYRTKDTKYVYSLHGSVVERQLSIRGGCVFKPRQIQLFNI